MGLLKDSSFLADARSIGRRPSEMAVVILLACLKRHGLYAAKDEAVKNFNSWVKTLEQTENLVLLGTVTVFSVVCKLWCASPFWYPFKFHSFL